MTTAVVVYRMCSGCWMTPSQSRTSLTTPRSPRIAIQAYVRMRKLVQNGIITVITSSSRQRRTPRARK
jgi:hypothetical protein